MTDPNINNKPRLLVKGHGPVEDKVKLIAVVLAFGVWDAMSIDDREAWVERAEIYDTPGGNLLMKTLQIPRLIEEGNYDRKTN